MKTILGLSLFALLLAPLAFAQEKPCDCWIDAKTGKQVPTIPSGSVYFADPAHWHNYVDPDGVHASNPRTNENYVRVPCPPPDAAQNAGHTIKKILEHVSIGVGGELGGEDRHRAADRSAIEQH